MRTFNNCYSLNNLQMIPPPPPGFLVHAPVVRMLFLQLTKSVRKVQLTLQNPLHELRLLQAGFLMPSRLLMQCSCCSGKVPVLCTDLRGKKTKNGRGGEGNRRQKLSQGVGRYRSSAMLKAVPKKGLKICFLNLTLGRAFYAYQHYIKTGDLQGDPSKKCLLCCPEKAAYFAECFIFCLYEKSPSSFPTRCLGSKKIGYQ